MESFQKTKMWRREWISTKTQVVEGVLIGICVWMVRVKAHSNIAWLINALSRFESSFYTLSAFSENYSLSSSFPFSHCPVGVFSLWKYVGPLLMNNHNTPLNFDSMLFNLSWYYSRNLSEHLKTLKDQNVYQNLFC